LFLRLSRVRLFIGWVRRFTLLVCLKKQLINSRNVLKLWSNWGINRASSNRGGGIYYPGESSARSALALAFEALGDVDQAIDQMEKLIVVAGEVGQVRFEEFYYKMSVNFLTNPKYVMLNLSAEISQTNVTNSN
jgi:hypothetical protein